MRWILLAGLLSACSTTTRHAVTAAPLEEDLGPIEGGARVRIARFVYAEHQLADGMELADDAPWLADGNHPLKDAVRIELRRSGLKQVVSEGPARFYVRGHIDRLRKDPPPAQQIWRSFGAIMQCLTLIPAYFESTHETQVVVGVFDEEGRELLLRKTPIAVTTSAPYFFSLKPPSRHELAVLAANEVRLALRDVARLDSNGGRP